MRPILRSNERQSRFIANASHEIKTPLTIISANNELVEIEHGENESTEAITKQIGKLNRMINSLTVLAKFENIKKNNKSDVFDFSNVLNTTVIDYKNLLEKLEVNLSVEDNIIYQGHEGLIHQMICNYYFICNIWT